MTPIGAGRYRTKGTLRYGVLYSTTGPWRSPIRSSESEEIIPETLYSRSPSSCTELYLILQLSSNNPLSSSGNSNSMAVLAYMLIIRCPAFKAVSRTYSDSSAKACYSIMQNMHKVIHIQYFLLDLHCRFTSQSKNFQSSQE